MLEEPRLWIDALPVPGDRATAYRRTIRASDSGEPLGFARWQQGPELWWWRWLAPPLVQVFETEDAALLCTIQYCWGVAPGWLVRDADGHLAGAIRGGRLQDRFGKRFAALVRTADASLQHFRAGGGEEVATLRYSQDGTLLEYGGNGTVDPFARMVLLAAALSASGQCK